MAKNKVPPIRHQPSKQSSGDDEKIMITIPLKGGKEKEKELPSEEFIKVIEYEYAVKYLEIMGIEPTTKMVS